MGDIRRAVESREGYCSGRCGNLAIAELGVRSELATDYFEMRGLDTQQRLLDNTVVQYEQYLQLTQARFKGGVATESDVALAQTQLDQTRAPAIDVGSRGPRHLPSRCSPVSPRRVFVFRPRHLICNCHKCRWASLRNCWSAARMLPLRKGALMRPTRR